MLTTRQVLGMAIPVYLRSTLYGPGTGPERVGLLGRQYDLRGIFECLLALESGLTGVLVDPQDSTRLKAER
jgi:hypothetical protein